MFWNYREVLEAYDKLDEDEIYDIHDMLLFQFDIARLNVTLTKNQEAKIWECKDFIIHKDDVLDDKYDCRSFWRALMKYMHKNGNITKWKRMQQRVWNNNMSFSEKDWQTITKFIDDSIAEDGIETY